MSFPLRPNYTNNQIKKAGKFLLQSDVDSTEYAEALKIVNEWRIAHAYPINTFNAYLRKQVKKNVKKSQDAIVAQRLKRLPTIIDKLKRQQAMSLVRMQDIGGIRAIVNTVGEVKKIQKHYADSKNITHQLFKVDDYIENPKKTGYRGVHLIYKYNNTKSKNVLASTYKGMLIEIQLRTHFQHEWATAVETASIFKKEDYKSSKGSKAWLEFFSLVSASFAHIEKCKTLPQYSNFNIAETIKELVEIENKHHFLDQLEGYSFAVNLISKEEPGYYNIIILNYRDKTVKIKPYGRDNLIEASEDLASIEKELSGGAQIDAVLVSVSRLKAIEQAYPNYFLNTKSFIEKVKILVNTANTL